MRTWIVQIIPVIEIRRIMRPAAGSLLIAAIMLVGCRSQAERAVHASAFAQEREMESDRSVIDDERIDLYLDGLGVQVVSAARHLDRPGRAKGEIDAYDELDVVLVHSRQLNAWVYGDDFTCITSSMLLQAEYPEEIVAVLCHEFAHLRESHVVEAKERELAHNATGDVLGFVGGAAGMAAGIAAQLYGIPLNANGLGPAMKQAHMNQPFDPHRPADEFEADAYGAKLYAAMGLDLDLYDDFLERSLAVIGDQPSDTHPATSERLAKVKRKIARLKRKHPEAPRRLDRSAFLDAQSRLRRIAMKRMADGDLIDFYRSGRAAQAPYATSCAPRGDKGELDKAFRDAMWGGAERGQY